jgi:hypothetical protein
MAWAEVRHIFCSFNPVGARYYNPGLGVRHTRGGWALSDRSYSAHSLIVCKKCDQTIKGKSQETAVAAVGDLDLNPFGNGRCQSEVNQ